MFLYRTLTYYAMTPYLVILVACRLVGTVLELRYAGVPTRVVDAVAAVAVAQA